MLRRRGWKVSDDPPPEKRIPFYPAGRSTPIMVPKGIDPGFSYNPGTAHIQALADKLAKSTALAEEHGIRGPAARTRQAVSQVLRDIMVQERTDRVDIDAFVQAALRDPNFQGEIALGSAMLRDVSASAPFARTLPADVVRHALKTHGVGSSRLDPNPITEQDFALIPVIVAHGRQWVRQRKGYRGITYALRLGDLDYVYSERIGVKRGNRLRGMTLLKTRNYNP